MQYWVALPTTVVLLASAVAATTDVLRFKVYNKLTIPLLVCGIAYHSAVGGTAGLVSSLAGSAIGFGVLIALYTLGAMGAGDVKFVAAIGAWLGAQQILPAVLVGWIAASVYAVVLIVVYRGVRMAWFDIQLAIYRLMMVGRHLSRDDESETVQEMAKDVDGRRKRLIPFSAMIGVGVMATLVWNIWLKR